MSEIRLRHLWPSDIAWIVDMRNKPENIEHLRNPLMATFDTQEKWFKRFQKDSNQHLFVIERLSGLVTPASGEPEWKRLGVGGMTSIEWLNRSGEMSLLMDFPKNSEWSVEGLKAITDYGHDMLNLHRLWVECYTDDRTELFQQAGFKIEGRKVQAVYRGGRYHDSVLLSRFKVTEGDVAAAAERCKEKWENLAATVRADPEFGPIVERLEETQKASAESMTKVTETVKRIDAAFGGEAA